MVEGARSLARPSGAGARRGSGSTWESWELGSVAPPSQSPREGSGRGTAAPPGRRGVRGLCGASSSRGSGAQPGPTPGGAGPPLPAPAGTLCLCPEEAGVQQMHAGGWGRGRGGRREPTTKLASVAERTAGLEWKEPTPAERSRDSGERGGPAGAAGTGRRRPGGPRAGTWLGSGFGLPALVRWPQQLARRGHASRPLSRALPGGRSQRDLPQGRDPPRSRPGRGLFSSPAGGWSQPRPLPLRTSGKNLRADGRGEWKGAGDRERRGQVERGG